MSEVLNTKSVSYWGVLARGRHYRLIVTARRASYGLQRRSTAGWVTERTFPTSFFLNSYLSCMSRGLVSAAFLDAARRVPFEPKQCSVFLPPPRASRRSSGGSGRFRQGSRRGRS